MVSSAWSAWSKCPPLRPCCRRGNQPGQTTQRLIVLYLFLDPVSLSSLSLSASTALDLEGAQPPSFPLSRLQTCHWGTELLFEPILLDFLSSFSQTDTCTSELLLPSCATPSVLCLICQPFPLFLAPCLIMPQCYRRALGNNDPLSNNTTDKLMVAGEAHAFKKDRSSLAIFVFPALTHKFSQAHTDTWVDPIVNGDFSSIPFWIIIII